MERNQVALQIEEQQDRPAPRRIEFNWPQESKARNPRDTALEDAMEFMGWSLNNKRELGRMLRGFKGKTPSTIYEYMSTARQEGKNPRALFLYLMGMVKGK